MSRHEQTSENELTLEQRRALRGLIGAAAGGVVAWHTLQGNVLSLYVDRLGFSSFLIGILFLVIQLPAILQIWSARYVDSHGCKRMLLLLFGWGPLLLIPTILAPNLVRWFGDWAGVAGVFVGLTGFTVTNHWACAGWMPMLRHNLPEGRRTELVGRVNQVSMRVALVVLLACSLAVGKNTPLARFQIIMLVGGLAAAARTWFCVPLEDVQQLPGRVPNSLWTDLDCIWKDVPFRRLMIYISIVFFGLGVSVPFRPIFIKMLGFSDRFTMLVTVPLVMGAYSLTARGWGQLADRFGSRGVYGLGGLGSAAAFGLLMLPRGEGWLDAGMIILAFVLLLVAWGGIDAGNLLRLFTIVPRENQSLYMAFYTICTAGTLAVGSFAGGGAIKALRLFLTEEQLDAGMEYRILFGISGALILLATAYSRRMRDLQEISTPQLVMHLRLVTQRRLSFGRAGAFVRLRKRTRPEQDKA